jgi:transketolase
VSPPPPVALEEAAAKVSPDAFPELEQLCVDTIRVLAIDAVERAKSGHPGMPMAMAPVAYVLYARVMRHNPSDPAWPDRDRFVLSAGHGSMLLYAALHLSGYDVSLDDLRSFRQWGSNTPGHPEFGLTPGVETTTGPLGQGFANAVGMAMAERFQRERYGAQVCDHRVFGICSDGDLMEGLSSEAASLAGHLGLGRIVFVYDDNRITIDGATDLAFTGEDVEARFRAYGWHVENVNDVNDLSALVGAVDQAMLVEDRPSLIRVQSVIACGAPTKAGTPASHGAPLGEDEVRATKLALGWDPDACFHVPEAVYEAFDARPRGECLQRQWESDVSRWRAEHPDLAEERDGALAGRPLGGLAAALPTFESDRAIATRAASGKTMQAFAPFVPTMIGGSADLTDNVKVGFKSAIPYTRTQAGQNVFFGVREHAMAAVVNGLALHGGIIRPYGATFLQFADYMRPALRLSALMGLPVTWVFSHDSVGLGEDGPTHQPIEHLASLRAIPGLIVIRPADGAETAIAWRTILERLDGPACLVLSRQELPALDRTALASAEALVRGGYVLTPSEGPEPDAVIVATGSEVAPALTARDLLGRDGISARVVSMPSLELFAAQDRDYRDAVLVPRVPSLSVEAGIGQGWERWVDDTVSIERFGASAPGPEVLSRLGITPEAIADRVRTLL